LKKALRKRGLAFLAAAALAGCGHPGAAPALPPAAEPQNAPPPRGTPIGQIIPVGHAPEGVAVDALTRTVAVATRDPNELVLMSADSGDITMRVPLPGAVRHLQLAAPGGPVLVPVETANALVRVALPQGNAAPPITTGTAPHDAAEAANGSVFVANEHGGTVTVLRGEQIVTVFNGLVQPAGTAAAGNSVGVVDVRKNDLTIYDADRLAVVGSTSAGAGPTHLVADRHGRMIATDTRGDTVRVFTPLPTPHEVASITQRGGPYGIAYDAARDRLWVASSGTNEVVGYDMSEPTPRVLQRFSTVQNPYTLGVDANNGRLFVAGGSAGVVQVIDSAG
jgi:DNA-binding beta-propeller fold protein YncE